MKMCVVCGRVFEDLAVDINYFNDEYICDECIFDECIEEGIQDEFISENTKCAS